VALVEAARYLTRFEASLAKARLEAADIPSFLFDMEMNWGGAGLGVVPARLMVDDEDFERAQAILAEPPEPGAEAD
jgi:hypothetical protein